MTTSATIRVLFAGGGTGGHLFPAIAIADRLRELLGHNTDIDIRFVGTKRGLEYRIRKQLGYPLHVINVRGLVRAFTVKNLLVPFVLVAALIKSYLLLSRFSPDIVVGTGGYVALPVLKVAGWKGIPTVLQEQNSFPGITTRQLASRAKRIYLGFSAAKEYLPANTDMLVTGNPVRTTINAINREDALHELGLEPDRKTILILGGSQGARAVNNAVLKSLQSNSLSDQYQLLWQTGKHDYDSIVSQLKDKTNIGVIMPFSHNMPQLYAAADVAVARAGALTLAELIASQIPAILVPYPFAAGDHQHKNARDMEKRNLATVIDEKELHAHDLLAEAIALLSSERYAQMKTALAKETENRKPAVDIIAEDIIQLIQENRKVSN